MGEGLLTDIELNYLRDEQEVFMPDTCKIERVTTLAELENDGNMTIEGRTTVYTGTCGIVPVVARRDRSDTYGEGQIFQFQYRIHLPWDADGIHITDIFTCTASDDADLIGREMEVRDVHRVDEISQRRLTVHDTGR